MKKIIILCALNSLISTTAFSMLATKKSALKLIKKNNQKRLRYDSILPPEFPQAKLLHKTMQENKRLKEENAFLERKLESLSGVTIDLTDERAAMPGKTKDRDFGHCDMNKE